MVDKVMLSDCGQYVVINVKSGCDSQALRNLFFKAEVLADGRRLLIDADDWVGNVVSMEKMLSIVDAFKKYEARGWRIAVVTSLLNRQTLLMESLVEYKGIELQHFVGPDEAREWLLREQ